MKVLIFTAVILATFFVFSLLAVDSLAQTISNINASVKISICGNDIIEGGENCEGSNLNGKSCQDLGFGGGTLSCDISCSYDVSACTAATPTPTPTPSSVSSNNSSENKSDKKDNGNTSDDTHVPTPIPTSTVRVNSAANNSLLSPALQTFVKESGSIRKDDLRVAVSTWVDGWKNYTKLENAQNTNAAVVATNVCDINHDGTCGVQDFSILLRYVEQ